MFDEMYFYLMHLGARMSVKLILIGIGFWVY